MEAESSMEDDKTERIAESLFSLIQIFRIMKDKNASSKARPPPLDPDYPVLWFLSHERLQISELGRRLQRSKPNMTAIIDKLEKEGKVKRRAGKSDRRLVMIEITPKGRRAIEERKRIVKGSIKRRISGLEPGERRTFCESLENVNSIAMKLSRD